MKGNQTMTPSLDRKYKIFTRYLFADKLCHTWNDYTIEDKDLLRFLLTNVFFKAVNDSIKYYAEYLVLE